MIERPEGLCAMTHPQLGARPGTIEKDDDDVAPGV